MISNIYLHHVLDDWYVKVVKPRLRGKSFLIRYADDFVIGCELEEDAKRIMAVLPKRFNKYGLAIHPEKTKLVKFRRPYKNQKKDKENGVFDFLGFTHYVARSVNGYWVIKRRTIGKRLRRAMKRAWEWCKNNRHKPLPEQQKKLCSKLRGHYQYYGIRGNYRAIKKLDSYVKKSWQYWLRKRSQRNKLTWEKFYKILERFKLTTPRIIHKTLAG